MLASLACSKVEAILGKGQGGASNRHGRLLEEASNTNFVFQGGGGGGGGGALIR